VARMSKRDLSEIISRDKPGYEIVEHEPASAESDAQAVPADAVTDHVTDLEELRRRYLGDEAVGNTVDADALGGVTPDEVTDESSDDEDEIVVLSPPNTGADPWAPGPGRKSVIVSGKERRVIAEQG
jgi:hypothetical protein